MSSSQSLKELPVQTAGSDPINEIRALSGLRVLAQSEITRLKNRIARWFSIYFPNYKDVYGNIGAVSGLMILRIAPLPEDIIKLGVEGVNRIWRDAKVRGVGMKRARKVRGQTPLMEWLLSGIEPQGERGNPQKWYAIDAETDAGRLVTMYNTMNQGIQERLLGYADALLKLSEK